MHIESATAISYQVKITVVTNSGSQTFGKDEIFIIDSSVTKVVIEITHR